MPYSVREFAAEIKSKYPEYSDWDDEYLAREVTSKHSEYADWVDFGVPAVPAAPSQGMMEGLIGVQSPEARVAAAEAAAIPLASEATPPPPLDLSQPIPGLPEAPEQPDTKFHVQPTKTFEPAYLKTPTAGFKRRTKIPAKVLAEQQRLEAERPGAMPERSVKTKEEQAGQADLGVLDTTRKDLRKKTGILEQAGMDLKRGGINAVTTINALAALLSNAVGYEEGAKESLDHYVKNKALAEKYPAAIGSHKEIEDLGDAGRYAAEKLVENIPMMLPGLLSGGIGGIMAKKAAEAATADMVAAQVAKGFSRELAENNVKIMVMKKIAMRSAAGAAPASIGMETGSIAGDIYEQTGELKAAPAFIGGTVAGAIETIPAVMAIKRLFGPAVTKQVTGSFARRLGTEGAKQFLSESGTEGLQTLTETLSRAAVTDEDVFSQKNIDDIVESMIAGGVAGVGVGVTTQAAGEGIAKIGKAQAKAKALEPTPEPAIEKAEDLAKPAVLEPVKQEIKQAQDVTLEQLSLTADEYLKKAQEDPAFMPFNRLAMDDQDAVMKAFDEAKGKEVEAKKVAEAAEKQAQKEAALKLKEEKLKAKEARLAKAKQPITEELPLTREEQLNADEMLAIENRNLQEELLDRELYKEPYPAKQPITEEVAPPETPKAEPKTVSAVIAPPVAVLPKKEVGKVEPQVQTVEEEPAPDDTEAMLKSFKEEFEGEPELKFEEPVAAKIEKEKKGKILSEGKRRGERAKKRDETRTADEAKYQKAVEFGYEPAQDDKALAVMNIASKEEGKQLYDISRNIEKAYANRDLWEPERLASAVKAYREADFPNKVSDYDIIKKVDGLVASLRRDGYTDAGKAVDLGGKTRDAYKTAAIESLQAMGKYNKTDLPRPITWDDMSIPEKKKFYEDAEKEGRVYTDADIRKEMAENQTRDREERSFLLEEGDEEAVGDLVSERTKERIKKAQAKATKRRQVLAKEYPEGDMEGEHKRSLPPAMRKYFSKGQRMEGPATDAEAVNNIMADLLNRYFKGKRPDNLQFEVSDKKVDGSAWEEDENAEISWNGEKATIRFRPGLSMPGIRAVGIHEIGHFGLSAAIRSDSNLFKTAERLFKRDLERWKNKEEARELGVFDDYRGTYEKVIKDFGTQAGLDFYMEEWMARALELHAAGERSPGTIRVYQLISAFFKRLLDRLGIANYRKEALDGLIADSVEAMREGQMSVRLKDRFMAKQGPAEKPKNLEELGRYLESQRRPKPGTTEPTTDGTAETPAFDVEEESRIEKLKRLMVDEFQRLGKVQKAVGKGQELKEDVDAYLKQELMPGKVKDRIVQFVKTMYDPLKQVIAGSGLSMREIGLYKMALHAPERNERIARINPKFREMVKINGKLERRPGSGMADSTARTILDAFKAAGKLEKLQAVDRRIRAIQNYHQMLLVQSGLVSADEVAAWRKAYKNYAPLKGFQPEELLKARQPGDAELTEEGESADTELMYDELGRMTSKEIQEMQERMKATVGGAKGFSVSYKQPAAKGRSTVADYDLILANIINQTTRDIITAGRNEVAQTFLKLVRENPNKKVWEIIENPIVKKFKDKATGTERVVLDSRYREDKAQKYMIVKDHGRDMVILLHDPALRSAMLRLGSRDTNKALIYMGNFNRLLSAAITRFSPEFGMTNFERDLQESMFNIAANDRVKLAKQTALRVFPAMKALWQQAGGKVNTEWTEWVDRFKRAGGSVEYLDFNNVEDTHKKMMRDVAKLESGDKKTVRDYFGSVVDIVERANSSIENASRLAYFRTLIENGVPEARAAQKAKNLTVNFNRKGEKGQIMNALYLFSNAAVQGTRRMGLALQTKRGRAYASALFGLGLTWSYAARSIMGDEEYEKIPIWTRMRNWIIPDPFHPGAYVKFPRPYSVGIFLSSGELAAAAMRGAITKEEAFWRLLFNTIDSFNPIGSGDVFQTFTPTFARPLMDLASNKDFAENPIYPNAQFYDAWKPKSQMYFKGVSEPSKAIASGIGRITGGSEFKAGAIDFSPEMIDYMVKAYTGGVGDFLLRIGSAGVKGSKEIVSKVAPGTFEDPEWAIREIPFARKVYGRPVENVSKATFYKTMGELKSIWAEFSSLRENDPEAAKAFQAAHAKDIQAYRISERRNSLVKQGTSKLKELEKRGDKTGMKVIEQRIKQQLKDWEDQMVKLGINLQAE